MNASPDADLPLYPEEYRNQRNRNLEAGFHCIAASCHCLIPRYALPMPPATDSLVHSLEGAADLNAALSTIVDALRAESGTIHFIGGDGALHLRAAHAIPAQVREIVKVVPVGKGMAGLAVQRNAPVNACNLQTDTSGDVRPGARATGMEGAIVVPMRRDG